MKASFFMRKRKLLITRFMQYIFLAVLERNLPPPLLLFSLKDNLPHHRTTPFRYDPALFIVY